MAKADRLERLDVQRIALEAEYRETLIAALERTAAGHWGLFDHQSDRKTRAAVAPTVTALSDLADMIADMRDRLLMEPFTLHADFLAARGAVSSSAVGEPKQARAWLDRLAQDQSD